MLTSAPPTLWCTLCASCSSRQALGVLEKSSGQRGTFGVDSCPACMSAPADAACSTVPAGLPWNSPRCLTGSAPPPRPACSLRHRRRLAVPAPAPLWWTPPRCARRWRRCPATTSAWVRAGLGLWGLGQGHGIMAGQGMAGGHWLQPAVHPHALPAKQCMCAMWQLAQEHPIRPACSPPPLTLPLPAPLHQAR